MLINYLAPPGFDYSSNQLTEGIHLRCTDYNGEFDADWDFKCTNKVVHHGAKLEDLKTITEEEAIDLLPKSDIIIFSSGGDMSYAKKTLPIVLSNKRYASKTVFLDGCDSNQYLLDPAKVGLYLKRELRWPEANYLQWRNVRGFTFGVYDFHFDNRQPPLENREIDIAFVAFGGSSALRKQCHDVLTEAAKRKQFGNILSLCSQDSQPLPIDEYRSAMRNAKIIINITGAGVDTLRFWEAMGFGAVLCSVDIRQHLFVRDLPEPRRHAVYFDSWSKMLEMCDAVVKNPDWWRSIRAAADRFIQCRHSTRVRGKQMIEMCMEVGIL